LTVTSEAGSASGKTKITVSPPKLTGNSYKYKTSASEITAPTFGETTLTGYTAWNGTAEISATNGHRVAIVECDASGAADKFGQVVADSATTLGALTVASVAGSTVGDTALTISPAAGEGNTYLIQISDEEITLPLGNIDVDTLEDYDEWDGEDEITAASGSYIAILEVTAAGRTVKGGTATALSASALGELTVTSAAGTNVGDTALSVTPEKGEGNTYLVKISESAIDLPLGNVAASTLTGYSAWDGTADITAATDSIIAVLEITAGGLTVKGGTVTVIARDES
jgi:hypothetical protein